MPAGKPRIRQRFGPNQDYLLAVQVNTDQPFRAAYGTLMSSWEKIANTLNSCSAFKMHHLKGPIAKNRFDRLVERHREWVQKGSVPDEAPSQDVAFMTIMNELVPKLNAAEAEQGPMLGKRGRPRKPRPEIGQPPEKRQLLESDGEEVEEEDTESDERVAAPEPVPEKRSALAIALEQEVPTATRQRFTPDDDLLMLRLVKKVLPFRAKFGGICSAWNEVAERLDVTPGFSKTNVKGAIVRYRFENLVGKYRDRVKRNNGHVVGIKGAPAGEREVILTELVALMDGEDADSAARLAQTVSTAVATQQEAVITVSEPATEPASEPATAEVTEKIEETPAAEEEAVSAVAPAPAVPPSFILPAPAKSLAVEINDKTDIREVKALLQAMAAEQTRTMEQVLQLHQQLYDQQREERRVEAERRQREVQLEREEREKDREALTNAVMTAVKAFLEENIRG